jgi:hypothetical protein
VEYVYARPLVLGVASDRGYYGDGFNSGAFGAFGDGGYPRQRSYVRESRRVRDNGYNNKVCACVCTCVQHSAPATHTHLLGVLPPSHARLYATLVNVFTHTHTHTHI